MSIQRVFTVYDSVAEAYGPPFLGATKGDGIRQFSDLVNSKNENMVAKHPECYTLFEIGSYDLTKGVFTPSVAHVSLGLALDFVKS